MLIQYAFPRFASFPDDNIFHQGDPPVHYSHRMRRYLDSKRPEKWIGTGGPVEWTARSSDLTSCESSCSDI